MANKVLHIGKNTESEYFYFTKEEFIDPVTMHHGSIWFQGARALRDCKDWARERGYTSIVIDAKTPRTKDREIIL